MRVTLKTTRTCSMFFQHVLESGIYCRMYLQTRPHTRFRNCLYDASKLLVRCVRVTRRTVKAILTDDVSGTGYRGEYVEIRGGFMRNFLFPSKKAIYATDDNRLEYEAVDRVREERRRSNSLAGCTPLNSSWCSSNRARLGHAFQELIKPSYLIL